MQQVGSLSPDARRAYKRLGRSNPFLRYGMPLISLIVAGSFGVAHLIQGRKEVDQVREEREWEVIAATKALSPEGPLKDYQYKQKNVSTLEEELKAIQKRVDIGSFDYKKIPRPGESTSQ